MEGGDNAEAVDDVEAVEAFVVGGIVRRQRRQKKRKSKQVCACCFGSFYFRSFGLSITNRITTFVLVLY